MTQDNNNNIIHLINSSVDYKINIADNAQQARIIVESLRQYF